MGYWGEALADGEQLWDWQDTDEGRVAMNRAIALRGRLTPKEAAFVDAGAVLFGHDGDKTGVASRVRAYVDELRRMHDRWPDDDEMAAFWALGLLSANDPASLRDRMLAGAVALEVLKRNPEHPGALHYAIHAFDDPEHAVLALPAARAYAAIAPEAPHALHMPAHIFVELGSWADATASCESAWRASLAHAQRLHRGNDSGDLHSLSWLPPLYAQLGRGARADQALGTFAKIVESDGYASLAFISAALSVTRDSERWDRLSTILSPVTTGLAAADARYAQSQSPDATPIPGLVRAQLAAALAMAAARGHDLDGARTHRAELQSMREQIAKSAPEFAAQLVYQARVQADELRLNAEIAAAEGNIAGAEQALRQALPFEVTEVASDGAYPGRASSYERLGELAFSAGRYGEAAEDFKRALDITPGRSRALYQAALTAERLGEKAHATELWQALAHNWADADVDFPGVADTRAHTKFLWLTPGKSKAVLALRAARGWGR